MAKVYTGPIVESATGSIGQVTFKRTTFGLIAAAKSVRRTPRTGNDSRTRDRFQNAMRLSMKWWPDGRIAYADIARTMNRPLNSLWVSLLCEVVKNRTVPSAYRGSVSSQITPMSIQIISGRTYLETPPVPAGIEPFINFNYCSPTGQVVEDAALATVLWSPPLSELVGVGLTPGTVVWFLPVVGTFPTPPRWGRITSIVVP